MGIEGEKTILSAVAVNTSIETLVLNKAKEYPELYLDRLRRATADDPTLTEIGLEEQ